MPVPKEPPMPRAPLQPPEAVQAVALVVLHVSVDGLPAMTFDGLAAKLTVGALTAGMTVTDAVWLAEPPGPMQFSAKLALPDSAPVPSDPETAFAPLQLPDALHAVASVALQVRVAAAPELIVVGVALRLTTGAGGAVTVTVTVWAAVPPGPVQLRV